MLKNFVWVTFALFALAFFLPIEVFGIQLVFMAPILICSVLSYSVIASLLVALLSALMLDTLFYMGYFHLFVVLFLWGATHFAATWLKKPVSPEVYAACVFGCSFIYRSALLLYLGEPARAAYGLLMKAWILGPTMDLMWGLLFCYLPTSRFRSRTSDFLRG